MAFGYLLSPNYQLAPVSATDLVVKSAGGGALIKVIVLVSGAGATDIQDVASGHAGNVIFRVPATPAVGSVYNVELPVSFGIVVVGNAANSGLVIGYA